MSKHILKNNKDTIEFNLDSEKSTILIKTIAVILNEKSIENWVDIVSKIKLEAVLFHQVYIDLSKAINDVRELTITIDLKINPSPKNPIFQRQVDSYHPHINIKHKKKRRNGRPIAFFNQPNLTT